MLLVAAGWAPGAAPATHPGVEIAVRKIEPASAAQVSYVRQIKPILTDNCLDCHSAEEHKGGLDASSVPTLMKGGKKAGPAIVPGKPDESPVVQFLRGLREPQMPKGNPALSEEDLHLIRQWIFAGAKDDSAGLVVEEKKGDGAEPGNGANQAADGSATQEAVNDLMFSGNNEERLFAQRRLRLALLPKAPEPPKVKGPVFNPIDRFIMAKWEQAGLKEANDPPGVCSGAAFLRRVYLDVIGVIPTAAEAKQYLEDPTSDKRVRLVDELLARNKDYAAHWTPFWEEAIGSANVNITGGIGSRGNHRDWIFQSFLRNKPFDLMAAELIDPTLPGYRKPEIGDANGKRVVSAYIRNETHLETIQSAANVGQVFLGTEMKCASCHNHFLNKEWPQARFLAFAGLFATNDLEVIRCEKKSGQFVVAKFPFDLPGVPETVPQPVEERLHRVAQLLIDPANPRFAKTIVNRLWKRYLGLGLFEPQDDFRLDQPPTNPELLTWLADDFMRHGYDLKHSIRLILTSRTYQLSYDPELEDHFDVSHPQQARYYRSPSLRRLDGGGAARQRASGPDARTGWPAPDLSRQGVHCLDPRPRPPGRAQRNQHRPADDVAVVQALELLNGEEFYERIYSGRVIDQAANEGDLAKVIDRLYWVALSRPASVQEKELGSSFLKGSFAQYSDGAVEADKSAVVENPSHPEREPLGDVLWALFTSPEFQYIR